MPGAERTKLARLTIAAAGILAVILYVLHPAAGFPAPFSHGVMRPGTVVIVAGMPRSGSTALFNIARLLMQDNDPNTLPLYVAQNRNLTQMPKAKQYAIQSQTTAADVLLYKNSGVSVVIKMHSPEVLKEFVDAGLPDVLLSSHRDPAGMLCSKARIFNPKQLQNSESLWEVACFSSLKSQIMLYRAAAGRASALNPRGIDYDMPFFPSDLHAEFRRVADLIGVRISDDRDINRLVSLYGKISDKLPGGVLGGFGHHPLTFMHPKHSSSHTQGCGPALEAGIQLDGLCARWQQNKGAISIRAARDIMNPSLTTKRGLFSVLDNDDAWTR